MRLSSMRYKSYVWPHNPETFTVEYRRQVAAHKIPMGGCVLQEMGVTYRVLQGEGEFAGADAYRAAGAPGLADGAGVLRVAVRDGGTEAGLCALPLCVLGGHGRLRW